MCLMEKYQVRLESRPWIRSLPCLELKRVIVRQKDVRNVQLVEKKCSNKFKAEGKACVGKEATIVKEK